MNLKSMTSTNVKEKLSFSTKNKIKFLMVMILAVTFEHCYTILSYFTNSTTGKLSTVGIVLWLDFMLFFTLQMFQHTSRVQRFFGWFVFLVIVVISGFLNIYYMLHNSSDEIGALISQILSFLVGGVSPLGIVFLGIVNAGADTTIAGAQAHRIRESEKPQSSSSRDELVRKCKEMKAIGSNNTKIADTLGLSRTTVLKYLK